MCFSITIFVLFTFLLILVCKGCWEAYAKVIGIWRKEDNLRELVLYFHYMGLGSGMQSSDLMKSALTLGGLPGLNLSFFDYV